VKEIKSTDSLIIKVPYVSVWDGGVEIETFAKVNVKTGEVSDITVSDNVEGLEICERQYVFSMMNKLMFAKLKAAMTTGLISKGFTKTIKQPFRKIHDDSS